MKILILSTPWCGAENIAAGIAWELNYKLIIDPCEPRPTQYWRIIEQEWRDWPTSPVQHDGMWLSPFNPTTIPTNTVGKHNVKWHDKLPGNVTEEAYCDAQRALYDRTICIGTDSSNIDFIAKKYMAYKNYEPEGANNYYWEYHRKRIAPPYEDSMWNEDDRVKIRDGINWLKQYAQDNSLIYINWEDLYMPANLDSWNSLIRTMGCGIKEHDGTSTNRFEFHEVVTTAGDNGYKY